MDFRSLEYVIAVAREGTIVEAARSLYISQPSLTKYLHNLEAQLGVALFYRSGRKYWLTYAGERYVDIARKILDLKNQLDRELTEIVKNDVGLLRVAFPLVRGSYILPSVLPAFKKLYPRVKVSVIEADSLNLEHMLLQGEVDLAFFSRAVENPRLRHEAIAVEEYVLILAKNHPLVKAGTQSDRTRYPWIDVERLSEEDFIMLSGSQSSKSIMENVFRAHRIQPNIALTLRNISTVVQMVNAGYGYSFVLESHVLNLPREQQPQCLSIGPKGIRMTSAAVFRNDGYHPQYEQDFIRLVREYYKKLLSRKD